MDRTERFYRIEQLLRERGVVTRPQFLAALEISLATLKRDLAYMRDRLHAPIDWDAERGGYVMAPDARGPKFQLPGLWFNPSEIHALLTMNALLDDLQPGLLGGHVAPLRARLERLLEEGQLPASEVRKRVRIFAQAARAVPPAIFETVAAATLKRQRLALVYQARSSAEVTQRDVSPQRLVLYRDNWYLDAWCHLRDGLRKFAVDAMAAARPLEEPARDIEMAVVERELDSGYGVFGGIPVAWARLRFSVERSQWVRHERWHRDQRASVDDAGRHVLEIPFADERELLMDILRHGAEVEVLEPPALVARVADEVRRMSARLR